MAPEVAAVERKGGYNQLCDIWAVGITAIGKFCNSNKYHRDFKPGHFQNWLNYNPQCSTSIQCELSSSCLRVVSSRPHWRTRTSIVQRLTASSKRHSQKTPRNDQLLIVYSNMPSSKTTCQLDSHWNSFKNTTVHTNITLSRQTTTWIWQSQMDRNVFLVKLLRQQAIWITVKLVSFETFSLACTQKI